MRRAWNTSGLRLAWVMVLGVAAATGSAAEKSLPGGGAGRSLTRMELEKIPLHSTQDHGEGSGLIISSVKTGVWLDAKTFVEGEPIPAWLILHSQVEELERGLLTRFDLGRSGESVQMAGSARVGLWRIEAGGGEEEVATIAGKPDKALRRVLVSPQGYLVNCGDVRNLGGGRLEAGDYVLRFWAEGQRSEARFAITAHTGSVVATQPAQFGASVDSIVLQLGVGGPVLAKLVKSGQEAGPAPEHAEITSEYLSPRSTADFSLGLAMGIGWGPHTRYYSRIEDVPEQDETLGVSAKYVPGSPDHLEVTLTPRATLGGEGDKAAGQAIVPAQLWLYLLVENPARPARQPGYSQREGFNGDYPMQMNGPMVLDWQLPGKWQTPPSWDRNSHLFEGKIRISVIVASHPVFAGLENTEVGPDLPRGRTGGTVKITPWMGVVRSTPMEVTINGGK